MTECFFGNSKSDYCALNTVAGSSPLHIACFIGATDVVCCLLEHKANINMAKEDDTTPLSYACELGHTDVVKILLEKNPNIDSCDNHGFTPLIKACLNNHTSTVQLLIKHKLDINARTVDGNNDLFFSSMNGNLDILKLLLENNADCINCIYSKQLVTGSLSSHPKETILDRMSDLYVILQNSTPYDIMNYVSTKSLDYVFDIFADSASLHIACFIGRLDVVHCLLENKANINQANDHGTTPLSYACELGHTDIVKLLLDKHAIIDSFDNDGFTPLIISCLNDNTSTIQLLMQHKPDINAKALHGLNALVFSVINGNLEIIQLLLKNNADCNICCDSKEFVKDTSSNPIRKTLKQKKQHIFNIVYTLSLIADDYLRDRSFNYGIEESKTYDREEGGWYVSDKLLDHVLNVVTDSSPLHIACFMGKTDVVLCLLNHKANINLTKKDGTTPLSYACEVGHTDIVKMLLEENANVNICDNDGNSPLIKSCMNNKTSVVQLLMKHKPDINAKTIDGVCGLLFSALNGNQDIIQILLQNNADCNICIYSKERMINTFKDHVKKSFELKKRDIFEMFTDNSSPNIKHHVTNMSLYQFWTKSLDYVIIRKKAVDYVFDIVAGSSPLHIACFMGKTDVVRCLLEHKANVKMTKEDGTTPLSYACEVGHFDIVNILLYQKANVEICDNNGFTPLIRACMNNHTSVVQLLIQHKPDINVRTLHGLNALFFSAMNGNIEIVQLLLKSSADCNTCSYSKDNIKDAFSIHANKTFKQIKQDIFEIVNNLLSIANDFDIDRIRLFKYAHEEYVDSGRKESVDYDCEFIDPVFDAITSSSPLHIACFMRRKDVVRCLLEHKANINLTKDDGTTPLFYACEVGHEDSVRLLLDNGADTQICRLDGKSPFDIARDNGHESVVIMLRNHSGDQHTLFS